MEFIEEIAKMRGLRGGSTHSFFVHRAFVHLRRERANDFCRRRCVRFEPVLGKCDEFHDHFQSSVLLHFLVKRLSELGDLLVCQAIYGLLDR